MNKSEEVGEGNCGGNTVGRNVGCNQRNLENK